MARLHLRRAGALLALLIFASVLLPRPARAEGKPAGARVADDRARFSASFRFGGSSREEAARRDAIERGIHTLFFAIRGIARSRLSAGTKIEPWVAFSFEGDAIRVRVPSATAVSPANGAVVDYVTGSDHTKLSQRLAGGKITQVFDADQGRRVNEWVLSPDASTLSLRVTVSSPKLSSPVVYTLTYARAQ